MAIPNRQNNTVGSVDLRQQLVTVDGVLTALGSAQYTDMTAARRLTDKPTYGIQAPANATIALIQAETQNLRWSAIDTSGFSLSASVGMLLSTAMDHLVFNAAADSNGSPVWNQAAFIGVTGGAIMNVQYFM